MFDLGPGDGGKGGVVNKLSCHHQAHTVLKVGGAQGSHGVCTGRHKFAFSQWGCGTFEGVKTHITPLMVANPEGLLNEADGLRYCGLTNAFDLLTIDERAICATLYHGITSRLKEIARKDNPRGTVGTGIGQAYRDSFKYPELVIRARDLRTDLRPKLSQIRDQKIAEVKEILSNGFLCSDSEIIQEEIALLKDDGFLDYNVRRIREAGLRANVVDSKYFSKILEQKGTAVVESSHGILTDNLFGFQPHVSAIRTLPSFTHSMLRDAGFDGEIVNVGVHRAYAIRHGAGPLPTTSFATQLLPNSHKKENRYQGKVRTGPLDLVLLRYAIEVCGRDNIDWLAITWFDQISKNGLWRICNQYLSGSRGTPVGSDKYFNNCGNIKFKEDYSQEYKNQLSLELQNCVPTFCEKRVPSHRTGQFRLCNDVLHDNLGIPVNLVSFGPSKQDKLMKE